MKTNKNIGIGLAWGGMLVMVGGLFFIGGAQLLPKSAFLGDVGITVGVAPNPYNTLNDQLQARQLQLDEEQADLNARATALASDVNVPGEPAVLWYLVFAIGVLAFFVGLNFYFDWRRTRTLPGIPQGM